MESKLKLICVDSYCESLGTMLKETFMTSSSIINLKLCPSKQPDVRCYR